MALAIGLGIIVTICVVPVWASSGPRDPTQSRPEGGNLGDIQMGDRYKPDEHQ